MKTVLAPILALALTSCTSLPPEPERQDIVPRPTPEVRTIIEPAAPTVVVLRTFDATGKPTGTHRSSKVTIDRPGFFAEFTDPTGPKRLYIRESKITLTAE